MKTERASRACAGCRARKVRCNGKQPCQACAHSGLSCTFQPRAASSVSRANSKRGSVLSDLKPPSSIQSKSARPLAFDTCGRVGSGFDANSDFFVGQIKNYWDYVFPACPIVSTEMIRESITRYDTEAEHAAFAYSFAAVTLAVGSSREHQHRSGQIYHLISRALDVRPIMNHRSRVDLRRIMFSVFLRMSFAILLDRDMEFFYHREAVAMLQMVRAGQSQIHPSEEGPAWQRLYWVIFIYERLVAVFTEGPATVPSPTDLPIHDPTLPHHLHLGFTKICELYRMVDDEFLSIWREKNTNPCLTEQWIITKQEALEYQRKLIADVSPNLIPTQRADLILTCQWLRLLVWQMATWKYLLHSDALQNYMAIYFPVRESAHLQDILQGLESEALDRNGVGIQRKLFEVVDVASDVLSISAGLQLLEDRRIFGQWLSTVVGMIRSLAESEKLSNVQKLVLKQKLKTLESIMSERSGRPASSGGLQNFGPSQGSTQEITDPLDHIAGKDTEGNL